HGNGDHPTSPTGRCRSPNLRQIRALRTSGPVRARCTCGQGVGERVRVTDSSEHVNGPFASRVPLACQSAVLAGSTRATAATPSPTPLPDASVNFTWIV